MPRHPVREVCVAPRCPEPRPWQGTEWDLNPCSQHSHVFHAPPAPCLDPPHPHTSHLPGVREAAWTRTAWGERGQRAQRGISQAGLPQRRRQAESGQAEGCRRFPRGFKVNSLQPHDAPRP